MDLEAAPGGPVRSLADIAAEGPRRGELSPGRPGVALIGGGAIDVEAAVGVVDGLAAHWPAIVVRVGASPWPGPTVPVVPLYPGWLAPTGPEVAVWQPLEVGVRPPGAGPMLPLLGGRLVRALLQRRLPRRSRWVRAWGPVWGMPWA
ncbi:MAG: hypothetical protein ACE5F5_08450 [Acidimicrobiia bacterium]